MCVNAAGFCLCPAARGRVVIITAGTAGTWPWAKTLLNAVRFQWYRVDFTSPSLGEDSWSQSSTSYSHLSLKWMCAFFVWLWTAGWTKECLLPSGIQITLTTVIYVAADWWFLWFELPSAASFPAWMNEVIKHSNYKSHWLPCIQGRVPPKPCCEACYPGDCPVQSKTELFWPSELVGGENIWDADLLPQHSKCIFLISQQGNAAIQQGHYIQVFFWGMAYISLTTAGSLNRQKGNLGQQW